jgi:hypothetical protein
MALNIMEYSIQHTAYSIQYTELSITVKKATYTLYRLKVLLLIGIVLIIVTTLSIPQMNYECKKVYSTSPPNCSFPVPGMESDRRRKGRKQTSMVIQSRRLLPNPNGTF